MIFECGILFITRNGWSKGMKIDKETNSTPMEGETKTLEPSSKEISKLLKLIGKKIDKKSIKKAIKALETYYKKETKKLKEKSKKKQLFSEEDEEIDNKKSLDIKLFPLEKDTARCFYLVVGINQLDKKYTYSLKGRVIKIPYPIQTLTSDVDACLITTEEDFESFEELLKTSTEKSASNVVEENKEVLKSIKRVLTRQKVLKIYPGPKKKKDLHMLHDLFLVDNRLAEAMPKTLGKYFTKGSKQFRTLRLIDDSFKYIPDYLPRTKETKPKICQDGNIIASRLKEVVENVYFNPRGSCAVVKIGRMGMTGQQIYENIMAVISGVAYWLKPDDPDNERDGLESSGFYDILSIQLKTGSSMSLPFYAHIPDTDNLLKDDVYDAEDPQINSLLKRKAIYKERKMNSKRLKS